MLARAIDRPTPLYKLATLSGQLLSLPPTPRAATSEDNTESVLGDGFR